MILCELIFTRTEIVNIYKMKVKMEVAQSRLTLWPHGLYSPWNSPDQNTGMGSLSFYRESSQPGVEPRSATLQVDSVPVKPQGKPKNTGVDSLSLLQGLFLTLELNHGLLHCRQIVNQLSDEGRKWMDGSFFVSIWTTKNTPVFR